VVPKRNLELTARVVHSLFAPHSLLLACKSSGPTLSGRGRVPMKSRTRTAARRASEHSAYILA